ncbi:alpha/beta fold hydrolase [Kineococcus arenarius]|uniref:alpha/beta fold hydrolase n=1 Tax=unclassified Kineococcus TaxID=2621656 RepID=UPI003D7D3F62
MHVVDVGSGTPLILLHGFGVDHRLLLPLDPTIEAAGGWLRIYLDLPGTAGTPIGEVASTRDVVDAVKQEIAGRIGDEPFAILGNSFGAMIARQVAHDLRSQVLGLATLAGVFVAEHARRVVTPQTVLRTDPQALALVGDAGEDAAEDYAEMAVVQSVENARAFLAHVRPGLLAADEEGLKRIAARYALEQEPEDADPAPFTQPCLLLTARQDQVVGYEDAWAHREHYPRATFVVLDAAGHNAHLDQPALTGALLMEWLSRIRAAAGS